MNRPFEPNITRLKKMRRKYPKGRVNNIKLTKYNFGIQALNAGKIFSHHLEAMRITMVTFFKRQSKPFIRTMPNVSCTSKPHDIRRGRGKGSVSGWYFYVRPGKVIVEFSAPDHESAKNLEKIVRSKLPIKTQLITSETVASYNLNQNRNPKPKEEFIGTK